MKALSLATNSRTNFLKICYELPNFDEVVKLENDFIILHNESFFISSLSQLIAEGEKKKMAKKYFHN